MDEIRDVEYDHKGRTWTLPGDLVALQIELARADAACRAALAVDDVAALSAARSAHRELIVEKFRRSESWWASFEGHDRWLADWALKAYVAALPEFVPAAAAAGE